MENKVLNQNLAHVAQYSKSLSDKILMTDIEKSNLQLSKTESGEYNLIFNNTEIHSNISAQKEAQEIAIKNSNTEDSLIMIYGLGLGYLPDEIAKYCPKSKIIIYEPNLEILKFVLSIAQIDALYKKNVFLTSDFEEIKSLSEKLATSKTQLSICFLNSYKALFYDDIMTIFEMTKVAITEIVGNRNTFKSKMPVASMSLLCNINSIVQNPPIDALKDIYKGKTAVILCAGPSLEENIDAIKKNTDKFVTFVLNPTLKLLQKHSITPDFIVNIDSVDNSIQFEGVDVSKSYFITEAFSYPKSVYRKFKKHFFYISDNNFFNYWLRKNLDIKNNLKTFGTSSYTAMQCALLMGFSKIIFVGQDLGFKNGKCYSTGSQYDCLKCVFDSEKQQYEIKADDFEEFIKAYKSKNENETELRKKAQDYLNSLNNNLRTIKDVKGNLIPTKADYSTFIKIFENEAKNIKEVELINSSDGANIEGYKNIAFEEAIKGSASIEKKELSNYQPSYNLEKIKKEVPCLIENLLNLSTVLDEFISIAQKLLKEVKIKKAITENAEKLIKKYNTLFDLIIEKFKNEDINNLLSLCAYDIFQLLQSDYLKNPPDLENALKKIIPSFEQMQKYTQLYIKCAKTINIR